MKYLKHIKITILLLIALLIGITVASLIYNSDVYSPWWAHVLVVIGAILLTLTIHELTHAIAFSILGIKIKAIYILIFMFIRKQKFFTIKINPRLIVLLGGLVVPLLPPVKSDEELEELSKKIAKSLIAAPIASIVFGFLWVLAFILILIFSSSMTFITLSITASFVILILTLLVIIASSAGTDQIAGDFVAYERVLNNKDYQFQVVDSYLNFNKPAQLESKAYLDQHKRNYLKTRYLGTSLDTLSYVTDYIDDVLFKKGKRDYIIEQRIFKMSYFKLEQSNEGITTLFMILYLYFISGEKEEAFSLLNRLEKNTNDKIDKKHLDYEIKRAHHLLGLEDNTEFLLDSKNEYEGFNWILKPVLDPEPPLDLSPLKLGIKVPIIKFFEIIE